MSGVAGRYARALFELARDAGSIGPVGDGLARFDAMVADSPDLTRLVRSPVFSAEEQTGAITAILDRAGITGLTANFLKLVAAQRRLFAVRDMARAYRTLADEARGVKRAEVTLAEPPSERNLAAIAEALRGVAGADVALDVRVDPSIIGGLRVKLGSRMIDASLKTKLQGIRVAMRQA